MVRLCVEATRGDSTPPYLHLRRRRRCQLTALPYARPARWSSRTRAFDRAHGVQVELVSLEDRPQPDPPARPSSPPGKRRRYCLPAAGRNILWIVGLVGRALPEGA